MMILEQEHIIRKELRAFSPLIAWDFDACSGDVARLVRLIHTHLFEEFLSVSWLEQESGVRGTETHRQFKRCTKFSMHQYVEYRRILAAMWLLCDDNLDQFVISYSIGYRDYRTFARAFRRQVGCPPSEYRNRMSGIFAR